MVTGKKYGVHNWYPEGNLELKKGNSEKNNKGVLTLMSSLL